MQKAKPQSFIVCINKTIPQYPQKDQMYKSPLLKKNGLLLVEEDNRCYFKRKITRYLMNILKGISNICCINRPCSIARHRWTSPLHKMMLLSWNPWQKKQLQPACQQLWVTQLKAKKLRLSINITLAFIHETIKKGPNAEAWI